MDNIIEPQMDYDFSKFYLGPPSTLTGGAYFTRLMNNNKPLYIQTPKSLTKQGFVKSGKKIYTDLMFDNNDTVFIQWMEDLEAKCQELIFSKGQSWFETKLEKEDIESAFTSPFKIFKSGKFYLLRVNVKPNIKIYDENEQIINCETITAERTLISILEIQGIKFTSRNFQIELELKQSMTVSPDPFLDECFIKNPVKSVATGASTVTVNNNVLKKEREEEKEKEDEMINLDKFVDESITEIITNNTLGKSDNNEIDLEFFDENVKEDINDNNDGITTNQIVNSDNYSDIILDIEELTPEANDLEEDDPNILKEVDLNSQLENNLDTITLKKPNQVYYEIYKKAREKAKEAKKAALTAYLEMKNIKNTYMLDDIDNSDSESEFDDFENDTEDLENISN
jgi:hypothetical protein